jgi:succinylglutamate desuccinylase
MSDADRHAAVLQAYLDAFERHREPPTFPYRWASTHGEGTSGCHLVIGSMVHGDECGSLPAVVQLMQELASGAVTFQGTVTFFIGNPEAGLADERFLDGDLNRVFDAEPPDHHEGRRARELKPILDAADVFLDLHQTILPAAEPFWIFPFGLASWGWARAIGAARVWVTRHPEQNFSLSGCCADEYVRQRGLPGITLELGQKGFGHGAEERAYKAIRRAMQIADRLTAGASLSDVAEEEPDLEFFETVHREPFASADHALRPGLVNFQRVAAGELLSTDGAPALRAPRDGAVLFPKYPPRDATGAYRGPLPAEIYRIIAPLSAHPLDAYGLRDGR